MVPEHRALHSSDIFQVQFGSPTDYNDVITTPGKSLQVQAGDGNDAARLARRPASILPPRFPFRRQPGQRCFSASAGNQTWRVPLVRCHFSSLIIRMNIDALRAGWATDQVYGGDGQVS